jgi:hypothetical protein
MSGSYSLDSLPLVLEVGNPLSLGPVSSSTSPPVRHNVDDDINSQSTRRYSLDISSTSDTSRHRPSTKVSPFFKAVLKDITSDPRDRLRTVDPADLLERFQDVLDDLRAQHKFSHRYSFCSPTADVILRSSDGGYFKVHRGILAESSPLWEHMFDLPQPVSHGKRPETELPLIDVQEVDVILEALLRLCYPVTDPELAVLEHVIAVHAAAEKYEMQEAANICLRRIRALGEKHPLRVLQFGLYNEDDEAIQAGARGYLLRPMLPHSSHPVAEYTALPAITLIRLFQYHQECQNVITPLVNPWNYQLPRGIPVLNGDGERRKVQWTAGTPAWFACTKCPIDEQFFLRNSLRVKQYPRKWWAGYLRLVSEELRQRPHPSSVTSDAVLAPTRFSSGTCKLCASPPARRQFKHFTHYLAEEVGRRIDSITVRSYIFRLQNNVAHVITAQSRCA